ncbi:Hypothetical predicted protein [Mytilus galloprovincialis]|uniref:Ubiquitin-like domain-containing protein n=1 Tax=Mytilus galloprovincialis TaxID=29158 RepID=A0A8B6CU58_MYTGA|nr:Hypothetical predicted protein [Mytilus galloprovincialis]
MATPLVDVYVKLPTGRTSVLKLLPTEQVKRIIEQIAKEEEILPGRVRVKYQGKFLDKSKTIGFLGICPETILKAEFVIPRDIKVYAKVDGGGSAPVDIQNISTLEDLKSVVERLEIVSPKTVKSFKSSGTVYRPCNTPLYETSIREESVIEVTFGDKTDDRTESDPAQDTDPKAIDDNLKDAVLSSFETNGKNVEVVFCFDTTGSMSQYLGSVRTKLKETCQRLLRDIPNIKIGIMAHGDYCDYNNYVIKIQDLTTDVQQLVDFASSTPSTGGGDSPECYEWALHKAQQLDWSEDSAKALVVIGDCEPHPPSYTDQKINWHTELDVLKGMGVKVYGVFCNSGEGNAKKFYEELADRTGGCLLRLANFSLITEMFLGVCYKESNPEQLEAFTEELKQEGKLTEETEVLMKQLENTKPSEESKAEDTPSYLKKYNFGWWNFEQDHTKTPQYSYNSETDKWTEYNNPTQKQTSTYTPVLTPPPSSTSGDKNSPISCNYVSRHRKSSRKGRGCNVM